MTTHMLCAIARYNSIENKSGVFGGRRCYLYKEQQEEQRQIGANFTRTLSLQLSTLVLSVFDKATQLTTDLK